MSLSYRDELKILQCDLNERWWRIDRREESGLPTKRLWLDYESRELRETYLLAKVRGWSVPSESDGPEFSRAGLCLRQCGKETANGKGVCVACLGPVQTVKAG